LQPSADPQQEALPGEVQLGDPSRDVGWLVAVQRQNADAEIDDL